MIFFISLVCILHLILSSRFDDLNPFYHHVTARRRPVTGLQDISQFSYINNFRPGVNENPNSQTHFGSLINRHE